MLQTQTGCKAGEGRSRRLTGPGQPLAARPSGRLR